MLDKINHPVFWAILCIGLTLSILSLSLLPPDSIPAAGLGWDKLNHAAAIAAVTFLAFLTFRSTHRAALAAFLYGFCLGALIEIFQALFTTTRSAEWSDLLADLIGAGLVWGLISVIQRKRELV